jgi:type I restriction enzyme S subunit
MTAIARLDEVAELNPRLKDRPEVDTVVSFLGMADVNSDGSTAGGHDRRFGDSAKGYTQFRKGDVLVAKITPCFENGKIAQALTRHQLAAGSTEFHVVRPDLSVLDGRYLHHYLRQPLIRAEGERRMTGSAGQRRVPESYLAQLQIPVFPLEDQRRIAEILDQADGLRAKRMRAIGLLADLTRSIFFDMFGSELEGSSTVTVEDVAAQRRDAIRTGPFGSQLLHSEFTDTGIPVLGIDNVVQNEFQWARNRFISDEKYRQLKRYRVFSGDVLITIMGTCGRCAVAPADMPESINTKHLCCITLDRDKCLPEFLHDYFLMHPAAQSYLQRTAKGAIMSGLNMGIIKAMPVVLPPLTQQERYVETIKEVHKQKLNSKRHQEQLNELFDSLQQQAFDGEL